MLRLVYFSGETSRFTAGELSSLADAAQRKNASLGVTGLLLYRHGNFLQVLEGEEAVVRDLYRRIQEDPRHRRVMTVLEEGIMKRDFASWSMAFRELNDPSSIPEGVDADLFSERKAGELPESGSVRKLIDIFARATSA